MHVVHGKKSKQWGFRCGDLLKSKWPTDRPTGLSSQSGPWRRWQCWEQPIFLGALIFWRCDFPWNLLGKKHENTSRPFSMIWKKHQNIFFICFSPVFRVFPLWTIGRKAPQDLYPLVICNSLLLCYWTRPIESSWVFPFIILIEIRWFFIVSWCFM